MGRIKTLLVKRITRKIMALHEGEFSEDFETNKQLVNKIIIDPPKKLRNIITGYVTRLAKASKNKPRSSYLRDNEEAENYGLH